ncbi:MAG: OmpH family outer membrane protein [Desulfobacteraceae bacterium]|nr:OmpH family outer membrane protein [Desulfobacteraceae bacterium]
MKIGKIAFITISFIFFSAGYSYGADVAKIGIIDFQRIFETSSAGKLVQSEINKKWEKMLADLKKKGAVIEELKKKLERDELVMSKKMREEKGREFRIKINDIKALKKRYSTELGDLENRLITRIKKDVLGIVKEVGKKEGYLLIIEKREAGVMYYPNAIDLTDKLIQLYNKKEADKKKS